MEIEFMIRDVFALTRPQWLLASNIEEAMVALQSALAEQQTTLANDRATEIEERSSTDDSDDDNVDTELPDVDGDLYPSFSEGEDLEVRGSSD